MHILFLSQIVPFPPDAGPKVKTWQVLRYLVERGHQVSLACFIRPEEEKAVPAVRELCANVYPLPIQRSRPADIGYMLRSLVSGRPFLVERDDQRAMRSLVRKLVATGEVDAIHADQLTMAQFAMEGSFDPRRQSLTRPLVVFDAHNAVWMVVERMVQNAPAWLKPLLALEARRVKRYEGQVVRMADHTLAVTEIDKRALLEAAVSTSGPTESAEPRISVIPITVDTGQLSPAARGSDSLNLVTLGTLHYPPNADGIRWFAREAFPIIRQSMPDARLTIIGKNPPGDFTQLAALPASGITVTGYVADLAPYLEQAGLMVIPVRAGGGMRVRILEAFARGVPVVTTPVGLEGIDAVPGRDVMVGETPAELAAAVVRLLGDGELRARLAKNGRDLVLSRYDRQVALKKLDEVYVESINRVPAGTRIRVTLEQTH